jgi:hypothetical protein
VKAESLRHHVGGVLPKTCASLDVREQERDYTMW